MGKSVNTGVGTVCVGEYVCVHVHQGVNGIRDLENIKTNPSILLVRKLKLEQGRDMPLYTVRSQLISSLSIESAPHSWAEEGCQTELPWSLPLLVQRGLGELEQ